MKMTRCLCSFITEMTFKTENFNATTRIAANTEVLQLTKLFSIYNPVSLHNFTFATVDFIIYLYIKA